MIRMKALRSFGYQGANEGHIGRGREFVVANEGRARDLEEAGLAFRLEVKRAPETKPEPPPSNEAAEAGPLDSPGGTTGEEEPQPSSHRDHPRQPRRSRRFKAADSAS